MKTENSSLPTQPKTQATPKQARTQEHQQRALWQWADRVEDMLKQGQPVLFGHLAAGDVPHRLRPLVDGVVGLQGWQRA
jgi:hypothetical protein